MPRTARLTASLVALFVGACSDDAPHRPPPPPSEDAGAFDAAVTLEDASTERDATVDADGGPGSSRTVRDYGTDFDVCPALQIPLWGDLRWTATIPEGASIRFSAQVAPAGESLGSAPRVTLGTAPPTTPPIYVADALDEAHRHDPQLRVTAELRWPSADAQPTLSTMSQEWLCLDRE